MAFSRPLRFLASNCVKRNTRCVFSNYQEYFLQFHEIFDCLHDAIKSYRPTH